MKKTFGGLIFLKINQEFKKIYCYFFKFYVQVKITILRKVIKWQFQKEKQLPPEKEKGDPMILSLQ